MTWRSACYARDIKIFKSIHSITDCNALQSDLNDLVSWSGSSGLIFNHSKCKCQCIELPSLSFFSCLPVSSFSD